MPESLDMWVHSLAEALQVGPNDIDRELVLDIAKAAAHQVARPAAPLTTYLVGLAAGRDGGGPAAVARVASVARELAQSWQVGV